MARPFTKTKLPDRDTAQPAKDGHKPGPDVHIPGQGKKPGSPVQDDGIHWYAPGPVALAYLNDDSFICGIRGPFRSAKSVTSIMKLLKNAQDQKPCYDGWKWRRTAIIRNTYVELKTTTIKTWHQWIPQHKGRWRDVGPPMHHIIDERSKMNWEIMFLALDRPDDVAKVLSMEISDAYVNEARETPKAIIDALTGRVGQFPAEWQGGCDNAQLIMDTNSPDADHWWHVLAEGDESTERNRSIIQSMKDAEQTLREAGILRPNQKLFSFHAQPGGRSPNAENIRNLRAGYYEFLAAGKDEQFVRVYVDNEYGFVMDGKPIYPEYKDSFHSAEFGVVSGIGLRIGVDFGLTPAATISQRMTNGQWLVHDELVSERMGILTFSHELSRMLKEKYPGMKLASVTGDPAGDAVTPEETTCFRIMQANGFPTAQKAPTNDPTRRREAVKYLLRTVIDGAPAIRIHRRCAVLRKAFSGGFCLKRVAVAGEERYRDVPDKNKYSHVIEGLEYSCLSAGEDRNVTVPVETQDRTLQPAYAESDYDEFNH